MLGIVGVPFDAAGGPVPMQPEGTTYLGPGSSSRTACDAPASLRRVLLVRDQGRLSQVYPIQKDPAEKEGGITQCEAPICKNASSGYSPARSEDARNFGGL